MGLFDGIKHLLGAKQKPPIWADVEDEELSRLWRCRDALPARHRLAVRDTMLQRLMPLPMAEVANPYGPVSTSTVGDIDAETLLGLCGRLHPVSRLCVLDDGVILGRSSFAVESAPARYLVVVFEPWRGDLELKEFLPNLPDGASIEAVMTSSPRIAEALEEGGCRVVPWPSGDDVVVIGSLAVGAYEATPESLRVDREDTGLCLAAGLELPLEVLVDEPTYLIGSLSRGVAEDLERLASRGWESSDASAFDMVALLSDAAGSHGPSSVDTCRLVGIPVMVTGYGVPLSVAAQRLVMSPEEMPGGEQPDVARAAVEEAFRWWVIADELDRAHALVSRMDAGAMQTYYEAVVAELRGDFDAAEAGYREVSGDQRFEALASAQLALWARQAQQPDEMVRLCESALDTLVGHPVVGANLVLAHCASGDRSAATEALEETQHAGRSWLGAMLDALVHGTQDDIEIPPLLSVTGASLAPLSEALCVLRAGNFEHGEALLARVNALCPGLPSGYGQLALHLCSIGRHHDARVVCERGLSFNPHQVYLRALLAEAQLADGAFEAAARTLRVLLDSGDDVEDWWVNLVLCEVALDHGGEVKHLLQLLEANKADMTLLAVVRQSVKEMMA